MKRTTIMADEGTLLELKAIAQRQGKSTCQVIREALAEYVVTHRAGGQHKNPLLALVGLGESNEETDVSERDEEILAAEIDPIRGWSLRSSWFDHGIAPRLRFRLECPTQGAARLGEGAAQLMVGLLVRHLAHRRAASSSRACCPLVVVR